MAAAALGVLAWVIVASITRSDPLPAGSVWAGDFRFRPPCQDYIGDVTMRVVFDHPGDGIADMTLTRTNP